MRISSPVILCIVGRKNAGKTELTVGLSAELNRRGYRVMTAKHGHGFNLDHPGRDSWRHRHEGGAARTVLASPSTFAVVGDWPRKGGAVQQEEPHQPGPNLGAPDPEAPRKAESRRAAPRKAASHQEMPLSELVRRFLSDADIVLAEGFLSAPEPKIEVFRGAEGARPLCESGEGSPSGTIALVTDRPDVGRSIPTFDLREEGFHQRLADFLEKALIRREGRAAGAGMPAVEGRSAGEKRHEGDGRPTGEERSPGEGRLSGEKSPGGKGRPAEEQKPASEENGMRGDPRS